MSLTSRYFTPQIRSWAYACGEVISIAVLGFCFSALFVERGHYQFGIDDPGMARVTAACLMALSAGLWVICNCLKQIDNAK